MEHTMRPLAGLKVVEMGIFVAAPACGRMLADLGAEVVKVESPTGDGWRRITYGTRVPCTDGENPIFDIYNAGKKGVTLNLKTEAGREAFHRLLAQADIFITNNRLPALRRLGLDYDSLKDRYPRLIYGSISGYGTQGPDAARPGFDTVAYWGATGFAADQHYADTPYPMSPASGVGDTVTGYILLGGILAALHARHATGRGDHVSTSLYGAGIWTHSCMIIKAQDRYRQPQTVLRAKASPFAAPFRCADGEFVQVTILEPDRYRRAFYEAVGHPELDSDPRFSTFAQALQHLEALNAVLIPAFEGRTSGEMLEALQSRDIACTRLSHYTEVSQSPQAWENGYLETLTFRNGGQAVMPANPLEMNGGRAPLGRLAPAFSEHTRQVLRDLGYTEAQVDAMVAAGAALDPEKTP